MDTIIFTEDEFRLQCDQDGSNLRVEIAAEVILAKIKANQKIRIQAPAPYKNIQEVFDVFLPKFIQFGVHTDLIKSFLNQNCQQTKSGTKSLHSIITLLQNLLALANQYGPKLTEALKHCNTPERCNVAYIKKILKNRTRMADEIQKKNHDRLQAMVQKEKQAAQQPKKDNSVQHKLEKLLTLTEFEYAALRKVASRQINAEKGGAHPFGNGVEIRIRMCELNETLPKEEIIRLSGLNEESFKKESQIPECKKENKNMQREVQVFVDSLIDSGYKLEKIKQMLPDDYKDVFDLLYGGGNNGQ